MDSVRALSIFYLINLQGWLYLFFYKENISANDVAVVLDEDTSKHVVQVLRMRIGELLNITNGKGEIFTCEITDDHRKRCEVKVNSKSAIKNQQSKITIAISPLKNNSRFEWFLEKATEIGINDIVPLICERTEKSHLKIERLKGVLISAMLQSQQACLPELHDATKFSEYLKDARADNTLQKLIAHCEEDQKTSLASLTISNNTSILIGPEGDFTQQEIQTALSSGFEPVSLGETRLRTETAGMYAAVLLTRKQD